MPNFESFHRGMLARSFEPFMTVHKRGTISINRAAFAALGSPVAVELLYDRTLNLIGLRSIEPRAENAYYVRPGSSGTSGPWLVSAMAFMRFHDIDTTTTRRHSAQLEQGVLYAAVPITDLPTERVTDDR